MLSRSSVVGSLSSRLSFSTKGNDVVKSLITCRELKDLKSCQFVDASWYLDADRNPTKEFEQERIPNSVRFDIDSISDKTSDLPHMLSSATEFSKAMASIGIANPSKDNHIIVYGGHNCFSQARCWWMLKYFGHEKVSILQGGLDEWKKCGGEIESGKPTDKSALEEKVCYEAHADLVVNAKQVLDSISNPNVKILDARGPQRFYAEVPEPREGFRGGHIPSSINIPFSKVLEADNYSYFQSPEAIQRNFEAVGIKSMDETTTLITSCGSGVTAAVLSFGLHLIGWPLERVPVYDGSWSEWGKRSDLPIISKEKSE